MRIFFAGPGITERYGRHALWAVNLLEPLREMGHEVVVSGLDWDGPLDHCEDGDQSEARGRRSQALLEEVRNLHRQRPLDLFFSYFYSVHVSQDAISEVRALGFPTVNFYCNAAHQFHLVKEIAPAFDYCWVPERQALPLYRAAGANPLHIQMGAHARYYQPLEGVTQDLKATFCGSLYADRAALLRQLLDENVPLTIFTSLPAPAAADGDAGTQGRSYLNEAFSDLAHHGPTYVLRRGARFIRNQRAFQRIACNVRSSAADLIELFARSQILLNLSNVYDRGLPGGPIRSHVRLRDFEGPLCRALYFPQYTEELAEYYDLEREVVAWKTASEAAEKARFFLTHTAEAERVRHAGYRRALAEHTAIARFHQLFQAVGLPKNVLASR